MVSQPESPAPIDPGTPGASARREHARRRAGRERRVRERHPHVGGLLLALGTDPQHETAWERGARGEELVAAALAKRVGEEVVLLHDRRIPRSRANIDHVAITPSGVWVIDTKRYRGRVAVTKRMFEAPKLTIAGRDKGRLAAGVDNQRRLVDAVVAELAPGTAVHGALCFIDAELPLLGTLAFDGVLLLRPGALAKRLSRPGPLAPAAIATLASGLAAHFPPA